MEDFAHVERPYLGREDGLYVGVFDGHGGASVAHRASREMHRVLAAETGTGLSVDIALPRAFRAFDETVAAEPSGAVAVVCVLLGASLAVANAGDSHAILVSPSRTERLTADHRLADDDERARVLAAGATIRGPYACLPSGEGLMCTRALGDRPFRRIGIIAEPAVATRTLAAEDAWLIAATDGVWDGLEPSAVGHLVRAASTAREAADSVLAAAVESCTDNVTVVAVRRA